MADLSIFAFIVSMASFGLYFTFLTAKLELNATAIFPSGKDREGSSMFPVRLVISNRASVGRTVCGIKLDLLRKYRKAYSIEPILPQYVLSGQGVISVKDYPMTIDDKVKSLGDSVFQLPLDISPRQAARAWIILKVSQKCPLRQDDSIKADLVLLNVYGRQLVKAEVTLKF